MDKVKTEETIMETENIMHADCIAEDSNQAALSHVSSDTLSHSELTELFVQSIKQMVISDPLLKDLNQQVTLDEVEAMLALEHGHAITVIVQRTTGDPWKVVVSRDSTLHQLKLALKHHVTLHLNRLRNFKKISWKYIWWIYDLSFNGTKLTDNNKKLLLYGISNKSKVSFAKKIKRSAKPNKSSIENDKERRKKQY